MKLFDKIRILTALALLSLCPQLRGNTLPETPILLDVMPKSGTIYLINTLTSFLNLTSRNLAFDFYTEPPLPAEYLSGIMRRHIHRIRSLSQIPLISKDRHFLNSTHAAPKLEYVKAICRALDRFWVHLRDPRQGLISWVHFYEKEKGYNWILEYPVPPQEYFSWEFSRRVDWHIPRYFASMVHWIEGWLDVLDANPSSEIKITTFAQMKRDPVGFFRDILAFYGVNPSLFSEDNLLDKTKVTHYRKGALDEWRSVLSQEQQETLNAMMTERMFERFHWER